MLAETLIFIIVLIALIIASYTDFKIREVPDWLNYGLIFTGAAIRIILSIVYHDWGYIIEGALGFGLFFLIALAMFYGGQWGGGDAKMVMGLGALIGLQLSWDAFLLAFIINIVIFGSIFGLLFSVYMVFQNRKPFVREFTGQFKRRKRTKWFVWLGTIALLILSIFVPPFIKIAVVVLAGMLLLTFYVFVYLKSVEQSAMIKWVPPEALTEGDWVVKDVVVAGKRICGPKDLGLEMGQIRQLIRLKRQKKIDRILVKYGIPFVPSFFIAFIVTYFWGNVLFRMLGII
jgi:prepilin signal peptidase PulO-like enzyme (type II secretory pathway)